MAWPNDPRDALPRINYSLLKRPDLERTLQEQAAEIDGMKQVFYRETDALREQLQVLNAENNALKAAAEGKPLPPPQAAPRVDEEELFKERMKPIIAKLVQKQREELSTLRVEKALAQRELERRQQEELDALRMEKELALQELEQQQQEDLSALRMEKERAQELAQDLEQKQQGLSAQYMGDGLAQELEQKQRELSALRTEKELAQELEQKQHEELSALRTEKELAQELEQKQREELSTLRMEKERAQELEQKRQEELSALRTEKELAQRELEQKQQKELSALHMEQELEQKQAELINLRGAFREADERARELAAKCEAIKAQRAVEETHSPHIQEYQRALAAAQEQNVRQEETIQALTRQLDSSAAHYRAQRAQALEYLRSIRESFDLFSQYMAPEEGKAATARIKPLFHSETGK